MHYSASSEYEDLVGTLRYSDDIQLHTIQRTLQTSITNTDTTTDTDTNSKDFPKERYNTYAKSCNSNLYTKYPGATYSGLLLGTMCCL